MQNSERDNLWMLRNLTEHIPLSGAGITVAAAGAAALGSVPVDATSAIITNPVPVRVAFGTSASNTVGTYFPAYAGIALMGREQVAQASIYWSAQCTGAYVQYFK